MTTRANQDYLRATGECLRCRGGGGRPIVDEDGKRTGRCTCEGKGVCEVCGKWRVKKSIYTVNYDSKTSKTMCARCHAEEHIKLSPTTCDACQTQVSETIKINIGTTHTPNNKKFCARCYQATKDAIAKSLAPKSKRSTVKINKGYQYTLVDLDKYEKRTEH